MTLEQIEPVEAGFTDEDATEPAPARSRPLPRRLGALLLLTLGLVAASDFLLFHTPSGLNLFLCAALVTVTALVLHAPYHDWRAAGLGAMCALLLAIPLLEIASELSFLLAALGLCIVSLATRGFLPQGYPRFWSLLARFAVLAPFRFVDDSIRIAISARGHGSGRRAIGAVLVWVMPLALALVFVSLLSQANPLIENLLVQIDLDALLSALDPGRLISWLIVAALVWPFLAPRLLRVRKARPSGATNEAPWMPGTLAQLLFGPAAVLRALLVFNALFLVQSLSDLVYLWAGQTLPDGMSYANYAHRGAYPLILTALLAALFVLVAMRPGGAGERSRPIRVLVYLWIAQNILLVVSSIFRLDLYVQSYSLTALRLAAGIWMALVAVGLASILARIALRRSNAWLVSANLITLLVTLYAASLVDFGAVVSRFNVEHSSEAGGPGLPLDLQYLTALGPSSLPALDLAIALLDGRDQSKLDEAKRRRAGLVREAKSSCRDWRCWTFRRQRVQDYAAQTQDWR